LSALLSLFCLHAQAATVSVAVAANVQFVFDDLKAAFKQESGHDLRASVNSSGKLTTQIMNGAPFHVFLSADTEFPEKLVKEGFAANAPRVYVYGALVLWSTKLNNISDWQTALQQASVSKIAVANPKTAPYGRETMRVLAAAGLDKNWRTDWCLPKARKLISTFIPAWRILALPPSLLCSRRK
jgi:molybdate transport system substrate-binding protein